VVQQGEGKTPVHPFSLGLWSGLQNGVRSSGVPAIDRYARGVCRTLGPRPGKLATDALQVLSLRGKPSRSSPTSHPLIISQQQQYTLSGPAGADGVKGYPETHKVNVNVR